MSKYYEQIKSNYSRDIDHLINFKRDGLWIKEKLTINIDLFFQKNLMKIILEDLTIIHLDKIQI